MSKINFENTSMQLLLLCCDVSSQSIASEIFPINSVYKQWDDFLHRTKNEGQRTYCFTCSFFFPVLSIEPDDIKCCDSLMRIATGVCESQQYLVID